jgi:hypothetical protein
MIREAAATPALFPRNNRIGAELFAWLLRAKIEAAGVRVIAADFTLPFNESFYLFTLGSWPVGPALAAVESEMATLGILGWAQIAWHDCNEGVFRLHHPKSGEFSVPTDSERAAEDELFRRMTALRGRDRTKDEC